MICGKRKTDDSIKIEKNGPDPATTATADKITSGGVPETAERPAFSLTPLPDPP